MDWVVRVGIFAEALSFVLIAPEILGAARLRSAQEAIEAILDRILRPSRIWAEERHVPILPGIVEDPDVYFVDSVASRIITIASLAVYAALWATGVLRGHALLAFILVAAAVLAMDFLGVGAVLLARRQHPTRVVRCLTYGLAIPAAPFAWVRAGLYTAVFVGLRSAAQGGVALLSGPNRLRAVVFGTGVLMLFGGLLAQFVATF